MTNKKDFSFLEKSLFVLKYQVDTADITIVVEHWNNGVPIRIQTQTTYRFFWEQQLLQNSISPFPS